METDYSDTSASANACTLFFLARHPHVLEKLQRKLDEAMPQGTQEWSYDTLASVPYLDDVIQESLRLKPPVITGTYRTTPPEGMQVDEVYIPGGINVFTPFEMMQTDERYWPEAKEFIPERWGERREEMGTDDAPFLAFSAGTSLWTRFYAFYWH
jgi:cytochrome P450